MLNGKFFTGLPPKMIDRSSAGCPNRQESHIYWPDDTHVETAVESRIKRRNSVLLPTNEKPLYQKQASSADNEVDTKQRFSKEFSQSSIQFYDNLNDNNANSRRSLLRNAVGGKKTEIAEKPTNTKLELPESVVDEAYTTAKKKQAYTSKIEFYDYVNEKEVKEEPQNNRNNLRKPKMDMNDKREMELNTKNSPKLQVKHDVRSLSEEKEQRKINNRDVRPAERSHNDNYERMERERIFNNEDDYLRSRRSVEPRMNVSPKRGLAKTTNIYDERYSSERDIYREPTRSLTYGRRRPTNYNNSEDILDYRRRSATSDLYENRRLAPRIYDTPYEDFSPYRRARVEPKSFLPNNSRQYYDTSKDRYDRDYLHDYQAEEEEIRNRMRSIRLKSSPPSQPPLRKQYYPPEEYYDDEPKRFYSHHDNDQLRTPTNRGSSQQRDVYYERENNEIDSPYDNSIDPQPLVNKIINPIRKQVRTRSRSRSRSRSHSHTRSRLSPPPNEVQTESTTKLKKHLRSSLCYNDGAIVADNDATRSPTSSSTTTKTTTTQRRNARSSATQRVSVGLPD